ncbi:MAG: endonuclease/exonuclease/phosphatase family protein [Phycisphaerales bacterium]
MISKLAIVLAVFPCCAAVSFAEPPLILRPIAELGPGAKKEVSGIVRSRRDPTVFWTLNDSGDEPRVYPVRADGSVVASERYPEIPGTLIGGAINGDWEDIALDASGRLIAADCGNNSNARADLTLYFIEEPEPTEGRTSFTAKVAFRYPDQNRRPAPKDDFNFDAEAVFTVGDDVFILSKNRSDTFTKLYKLDDRATDRVNTLTYIDRFDVKGRATGADASDDGLKLAVLTYDRVWVFERADVRQSFFSGRVRSREYAYEDGKSDSEAICFRDDDTLLIADESRATLYSVALRDLPEVQAPSVPALAPTDRTLRVMSLNIRYASADDGANAWPHRKSSVEHFLRHETPDVLGLQEVEAEQADWLRAQFPEYDFHGVGRIDGERKGEFAPIMVRASRFERLDAGHFWLSPTPDVPGVKGWDAACERMASWMRVKDRETGTELFLLNTHLDHVGTKAREESIKLIRAKVAALANGAPVVLTGDFNCAADAHAAAGFPDLRDSFRTVFPLRDADEATFTGWKPTINGERIDWILTSDRLEAVDAGIQRVAPGGHPLSDHYPVTALLRAR